MAQSKLKNSYTVQYKDASGTMQFGEIQRFSVLHHHHFALVTKLTPTGSIMSDIKSSSNVLNRFCNSGILLNHMTITKRSKCIFCILLHNIKRKCVVVKSELDEVTISTFPNMVEHDWLLESESRTWEIFSCIHCKHLIKQESYSMKLIKYVINQKVDVLQIVFHYFCVIVQIYNTTDLSLWKFSFNCIPQCYTTYLLLYVCVVSMPGGIYESRQRSRLRRRSSQVGY